MSVVFEDLAGFGHALGQLARVLPTTKEQLCRATIQARAAELFFAA